MRHFECVPQSKIHQKKIEFNKQFIVSSFLLLNNSDMGKMCD